MRSRIYIEITNRCNLSCDFCPGTRRPLRTMTPAEFRTLTQKLSTSMCWVSRYCIRSCRSCWP